MPNPASRVGLTPTAAAAVAAGGVLSGGGLSVGKPPGGLCLSDLRGGGERESLERGFEGVVIALSQRDAR